MGYFEALQDVAADLCRPHPHILQPVEITSYKITVYVIFDPGMIIAK
jgi:hypothetical protein